MLFFKVSQHTKSEGLADSVNGVNADELAQKMNLLGTGVSINWPYCWGVGDAYVVQAKRVLDKLLICLLKSVFARLFVQSIDK